MLDTLRTSQQEVTRTAGACPNTLTATVPPAVDSATLAAVRLAGDRPTGFFGPADPQNTPRLSIFPPTAQK